MPRMNSLVDELFSTDAGDGAEEESGKTKTAEAVFSESLGLDVDEFEGVSDADLEATIAQLEAQAAQENGVASLDETASERLQGEVATHAFLHEEQLIKEAMLAGTCRVCKNEPVDKTVHPSICTGCLE